jgi:hypothetical protein
MRQGGVSWRLMPQNIAFRQETSANSTLTGSLAAIERLREATPLQEAFSSGIAVWDRKEDLTELLRRPDLALCAAKEAGRGRTEVAPPLLEPLPTPPFGVRRATEDGARSERVAG